MKLTGEQQIEVVKSVLEDLEKHSIKIIKQENAIANENTDIMTTLDNVRDYNTINNFKKFVNDVEFDLEDIEIEEEEI